MRASPPLQSPLRRFLVGAQSAAADAPNPLANPSPPPSTTPDVPESLGKPPPHKAQIGYYPPPLYENYNRYTSSGRTAAARKSQSSSLSKNFSTPCLKSRDRATLYRNAV